MVPRKRDIALQFLMESSFIPVSGRAIGMAAGQMMSLAIAKVLRYPMSVSVGPCFPSRGHRRAEWVLHSCG
jgi:hypothetical protein